MKLAFVLLVVTCSAGAQAQAVHRCADGPANITYQDTPCPASTGSRAGATAEQPGVAPNPFLEAPEDALGDWNAREPIERLLWRKQQELAMVTGAQQRQKLADDRRATQYAENRRQCATALRIATLCGKYAGMFYCDEKGFQSIPQDERVRPAALDDGGKYEMQRCAVGDAKNGSRHGEPG